MDGMDDGIQHRRSSSGKYLPYSVNPFLLMFTVFDAAPCQRGCGKLRPSSVVLEGLGRRKPKY